MWAGIAGEGGIGNLIEANTVTGALLEGIRIDEFQRDNGIPAIDNVIRANLVNDAGTDGIAIETSTDENSNTGTVTGNVVDANVVVGSGHDGIHVTRPQNTIGHNVVLHSGALGIEAVAGVIDGGGNLAHFNRDPRQCLQVVCR